LTNGEHEEIHERVRWYAYLKLLQKKVSDIEVIIGHEIDDFEKKYSDHLNYRMKNEP